MSKETTIIVVMVGGLALVAAVYFYAKSQQKSTNPLTALLSLGTGIVEAL